MQEGERLLVETKPCLSTERQVHYATSADKVRTELKNFLVRHRDGEARALYDGGINVEGSVPLEAVFSSSRCYCKACSSHARAVGACGGSRCSVRPKNLTAAQLDAYARLQTRLRVWIKQAQRFRDTTHFSPIPFAVAKHRRRDAYFRLFKALAEMGRNTSKLLKLRFEASRASIRWAVLRVAVRRWKLAHILFEAKHGPSYALGGPGRERDLQAFRADLPHLV